MEFENIFKHAANSELVHKKICWLLLKIKFNEAIKKNKKHIDDEEYKYENPIEVYLGDEFY